MIERPVIARSIFAFALLSAIPACSTVEVQPGDGGGGGTTSSASTTGAGGGMIGQGPVAPCNGPEVWVDTYGRCGGSQPCFAEIQTAIDEAGDDLRIWVFPGTYGPGTETHVVDATQKMVCLRSTGGPAVTILDSEDAGTTVVAGYAGALWIEGFTVRHGGPTGSNISDGYGIAMGGWEETRGWIVNNVIEENTIGDGAVILDSGTVDTHADLLLSGNIIRNNQVNGSLDGVVYVNMMPGSGLIRIENNLLYDNATSGLHAHLAFMGEPSARLEIVNNTIFGHGRGLVVSFAGLILHNNIITGNDEDVVQVDYVPSADIRSNLLGAGPGIIGQNGNITGDPQFGGPLNGDFTIPPSSPACAAGDVELAPEIDIAHQVRDPAAPGLGAYACD